MTLKPELDALTPEPLGPANTPEVLGLLASDPVLNVYLIALAMRDALGRPRDVFWGVRRDGRLRALLYLGGQSGAVLPAGSDADAMSRLGPVFDAERARLPARYQVIGPRDLVEPLVASHLVQHPARLDRQQQYLWRPATTPLPAERVMQLRPARREDYALVYESGAALRQEELLEDPRATDPASYARRVEEDCRDGHTWVWRDARGLAFRASISALTPDAAQISGVYVPPGRRGQGLARRGLAELCARLATRTRSLCLFVNDFNAPAMAVYDRLGFEPRSPWRSVFFGG